MKKVVKFGGSSLASAEQFRKVGEIIHADENRKYVVPSAPGKRYDGDTKVTDMLYGCYKYSLRKDHDFMKEMTQIEKRYQEIIDGLNLDLNILRNLTQLLIISRKRQELTMQPAVESISTVLSWQIIWAMNSLIQQKQSVSMKLVSLMQS